MIVAQVIVNILSWACLNLLVATFLSGNIRADKDILFFSCRRYFGGSLYRSSSNVLRSSADVGRELVGGGHRQRYSLCI